MNPISTTAEPNAPFLSNGVSRRAALRLGSGGLTALLVTTKARRASARQDATPAPTSATGVTIQPMGSGQPASTPDLELTLRRFTLAPDGRVPPHSHPGALVIFVEAGTFAYTALGGTAELTRSVDAGTPAPAEAMPTGTEVLLNPGDWLYVEDPEDDVRNAGEDDVVLLIAGLTQVGEPFTTFMDEMDMGSPAASTAPW
jgi:hypothetical protein